LHLGAATRVDLLRRKEVRASLLEALEDVDRLVLLGDVLELRHGPRRDAMGAARPFFEDLGRVMADREIVVSAGNHDHALIEPWLARRAETQTPGALAVEQRLSAAEASPMMAQLAAWAAPANLSVAYPGLWVRPDVYATHGHYLDCHLTVPTMERLGIGAMGRMLRRPAQRFTGADDYEAVMAPVFAWIDAVAQQAPTGETLNGATTVRAWRALRGGHGANGGLVGALRARALAGAFPLAVSALNRAGLGPVRADISSDELRRAGLRAMGEVAWRLGVADAPVHVVFGHTHRAGPLPGDERAEWTSLANVRLVNTGCWTYDGYFLTSTPGESPYWPGSCVLVEDDGPPLLTRLLAERSHSELQPQSIS
jgi:hypothetical protein